jgi:hypothetical protein
MLRREILLTIPSEHFQHKDTNVESHQYGAHRHREQCTLDRQQPWSYVLSQVLCGSWWHFRATKLSRDKQVVVHGYGYEIIEWW